METRVCSKCGITKPLAENYYRNRNSRGGWTAHCKGCHFRRARKPPKAPSGYKKCTGCGEVKLATSEFWHSATRGKYGLHAKCKPCVLTVRDREKHGRWYYQNREGALADQRERVARRKAERPNEFYGTFARWRERNRERIRQGHREWVEAHRESVRMSRRASQAKRRATEAKAQGKYSPTDVEKQLHGQKGRCWWCNTKVSKFHVDHVIPLSKGGSNGPENIVISCPTCNISKGAKMPWQIERRRLL